MATMTTTTTTTTKDENALPATSPVVALLLGQKRLQALLLRADLHQLNVVDVQLLARGRVDVAHLEG